MISLSPVKTSTCSFLLGLCDMNISVAILQLIVLFFSLTLCTISFPRNFTIDDLLLSNCLEKLEIRSQCQ